MQIDQTLTNELILYFAAAAKEAIGKTYYFLKYDEPKTPNQDQKNETLIYYAALDGDRLVLLYDTTKQSFSVYHYKHQGLAEPFKMTDHQDVIRAIKLVNKSKGQQNEQHHTDNSL